MVLGRKKEGGPRCQERIHHTQRNTGASVELARADRSISELARVLEPTVETIRQWVKQAGLDESLRSDGLTKSECEELARLRRENRCCVKSARYCQKPRPGSRLRPARCRHGVPMRESESSQLRSCTMCRVLAVSASGYYAWLTRPSSALARADSELAARFTTIQSSRATYGAPRIHEELAG
jgi:transposase-like protein